MELLNQVIQKFMLKHGIVEIRKNYQPKKDGNRRITEIYSSQ